jgi:hypothetical protein
LSAAHSLGELEFSVDIEVFEDFLRVPAVTGEEVEELEARPGAEVVDPAREVESGDAPVFREIIEAEGGGRLLRAAEGPGDPGFAEVSIKVDATQGEGALAWLKEKASATAPLAVQATEIRAASAAEEQGGALRAPTSARLDRFW